MKEIQVKVGFEFIRLIFHNCTIESWVVSFEAIKRVNKETQTHSVRNVYKFLICPKKLKGDAVKLNKMLKTGTD